jgi:hypothetical protein
MKFCGTLSWPADMAREGSSLRRSRPDMAVAEPKKSQPWFTRLAQSREKYELSKYWLWPQPCYNDHIGHSMPKNCHIDIYEKHCHSSIISGKKA